MVAVLVKIFGFDHLGMIEDVVQDALLKALETWKYKGVPDHPKSWLYRAAKNRAIDIIRHKRHSQDFDFTDPERQLLKSEYTLVTQMDSFWSEANISDDFLGMMFACCHEGLSSEQQITFILKALCGFSTKEIAKSFLTTEDAISKRLYRTRLFFRKEGIQPSMPPPSEITRNIGSVLTVIYLIFNEGYSATHSDQPIREDLIAQALFLCRSLLQNKRTNIPEVNALMALMCFHAARVESRLSPQGAIVLLDEQDRTKWNASLIQAGNQYLNHAATGHVISSYHLEAAIAYEHCIAPNYSSTNWQTILKHYDGMLSINYDPVTYLNRCLVIMELSGPVKALEALNELKVDKKMKAYYLYYAILGMVHMRGGQLQTAKKNFEKAHSLTASKHERVTLKERIELVEKRLGVR